MKFWKIYYTNEQAYGLALNNIGVPKEHKLRNQLNFDTYLEYIYVALENGTYSYKYELIINDGTNIIDSKKILEDKGFIYQATL